MTRPLKMLLIAAVFLLLFPAVASGHAYLERTFPLQDATLEEPPAEIRLTFTEEVDHRLSRIALEDEKGIVIEGELSSADGFTLVYAIPRLESGVYRVKWQVLSADTHVTDGSFRFAVAVPLNKERPSETISLDEPADSPGPASSGPGAAENAAEAPAEAAPESPAETGSSAGPRTPAVPEDSLGPAEPSARGESGFSENSGEKGSSEPVTASPPLESGAAAEEGEAATDSEGGVFESPAESGPERPQPGEGTDEREADPARADQLHDHHAGHAAGDHGGWQENLLQLVRIVELFTAASISGFLFFRYGILHHFKPAAIPGLFSEREERRLFLGALLVFAVSGAVRVAVLSARLSGIGADSAWEIARTIIASTMAGSMAWLRPLLALALLAAARFLKGGRALTVKTAAALAISASFPLTGHAFAISEGAGAAILSHLVHLSLASVWYGGLVGIYAAVRPSDGQPGNWDAVHAMIRRFSKVALPAVLIMAASGIVLALLRLDGWKALTGSEYGRLVLLKALILLSVVAIGAWHRLVLIPRMADAGAGGGPDAMAQRRFALAIRTEIFLAAALILLAGMLATTPPPEKSLQFESVYWHEMGENAHMTFRVNAGPGGQIYRLDVWLPEGTGAPASVEARMAKTENPDAAFTIPYEYRAGGPDPYGFPGFDKYIYDVSGDWLKEHGEWIVTIRITDAAGNILRYNKTISVSP